MNSSKSIWLFAPNQQLPDVTVRGEDYLSDPDVETTHDDWYAQTWETEIEKVLFGNPTENQLEETTNIEITETIENGAVTTENAVVKTTVESSEGDKTSTDNILHSVSSSLLIFFFPPPTKSSPKTSELPPVVVGYNPRKVGRHNLLPNPRPNTDLGFRLFDSVTTENLRQSED